MDIKYAILGFLSWKPFTGYELKKAIAESPAFYWSGNNNQIYTALVQLHKDGLVLQRVEPQERYPSRKVYSITPQGQSELTNWVISNPELPQLKKSFLVQLAWSNGLEKKALDDLLSRYEHEIEMQLLMLNERVRRSQNAGPARNAREKYIWDMIMENFIRSSDAELQWVRELRRGLAEF